MISILIIMIINIKYYNYYFRMIGQLYKNIYNYYYNYNEIKIIIITNKKNYHYFKINL